MRLVFFFFLPPPTRGCGFMRALTVCFISAVIFVLGVTAEPTVRELLAQKFSVAVVCDTYGAFRTRLELQPSINFEESLTTTEAVPFEGGTVTPAWFEVLRMTVDLHAADSTSGTAQLFFVPVANSAAGGTDEAAANISFDFNLKKPTSDSTFVESSGNYKTNGISYGVYWWRFTSQSEFTLQFVDHIFSNTTTFQGSSPATLVVKETKPWYQSWGLVLVTGGVFLMRLWLNGMQSRRQLKKQLVAADKKKK